MDRYLVVSPHTDEDCKNALKQVLAAGYLTHFEWGCMDGDHTGWVILEAENAKEALMVVPTGQRASAKAIKLAKFSQADVEKMHHI
ncbi:MAG TPA: hypothetical protein VGB89_01655 [Bacteroidota bacterium]|jgi:hypothetical protein